MILESHARTAAHTFQRSGCYESTLPTILHNARMTMHTGRLPNLLSRGGKGVYPWLAMLRDRLTNTTDAYQLTRLRKAERPTGLIVYERLVQLNLQERLRAPDLRVTAFTTPSARSLWRRLLPTGPSRGYNRCVWRPMRDIFVVPEPQARAKWRS